MHLGRNEYKSVHFKTHISFTSKNSFVKFKVEDKRSLFCNNNKSWEFKQIFIPSTN